MSASSPPLRLVVFDVDGTLVDSQRHIHTAMTDAFRAGGHAPPPLAEVLQVVGLSLPEAVARLAPALALAEAEAVVAAYKSSYSIRRAEEMTPLYPGAFAAVDALAGRPDLLLGVATGKSRRGLDHVLQAHGLAGHFITRQVADDHPSKPHPSMLFAALAEAGVEPAAAVMVGDTTYDIEMGRAAGMRTLGVAWGYHAPAALAAAGADRVIADFAALEPALAELWEA